MNLYWLTNLLTSPVRTLVGLVGAILAAIVLLIAVAHSAQAMAALAGIFVALLMLVAVQIPIRWVLVMAGLAFVVVGSMTLIWDVISSGVLVVLLIVTGLAALAYAWRWSRVARYGYSPLRWPRPRRPWRRRRPMWW